MRKENRFQPGLQQRQNAAWSAKARSLGGIAGHGMRRAGLGAGLQLTAGQLLAAMQEGEQSALSWAERAFLKRDENLAGRAGFAWMGAIQKKAKDGRGSSSVIRAAMQRRETGSGELLRLWLREFLAGNPAAEAFLIGTIRARGGLGDAWPHAEWLRALRLRKDGGAALARAYALGLSPCAMTHRIEETYFTESLAYGIKSGRIIALCLERFHARDARGMGELMALGLDLSDELCWEGDYFRPPKAMDPEPLHHPGGICAALLLGLPGMGMGMGASFTPPVLWLGDKRFKSIARVIRPDWDWARETQKSFVVDRQEHAHWLRQKREESLARLDRALALASGAKDPYGFWGFARGARERLALDAALPKESPAPMIKTRGRI